VKETVAIQHEQQRGRGRLHPLSVLLRTDSGRRHGAKI
jgi:hypothetical protein